MRRWTLLLVLVVLAAPLLLHTCGSDPSPREHRESESAAPASPAFAPRRRARVGAEAAARAEESDAAPAALAAALPQSAPPADVLLRVVLRSSAGSQAGGAVRLRPGRRVAADDAGVAELRVQAGTPFELEAELPGHTPARVGRVRLYGDTTIPVVLRPDRSLRVTIRDPDGAPVRAGYVLLAEVLDGDFAVEAVVSADADGVVERDHLPRTQCVVVVREPGFATAVRYVDGAEEEVCIALQRAEDLAGVVTLDGRPVEDVEVWYGEERRLLSSTGAVALTDADGRFLLTDVPSDADVRVRAERDGVGGGAALVKAGARRDDVRISLLTGDTLRGQVVDEETGAGVAGVDVTGGFRLAPGFDVVRVASDADGRFEVRGGGAPDSWPGVVSDAAGWEQVARRIEVADDGGERLILVVAPLGTAIGRVVDPDGRPVAGARVAVGAADQAIPAWSDGVTYTARDGSFRLDGVRRRWAQQVGATHPDTGTGFAELTSRPAPLAPVTIVLSGGAALAGRVVDEAGRPVAGVSVHLHRESDPISETLAGGVERPTRGVSEKVVTDTNGSYSFDGLSRGMRYRVVAWTPDGSPPRASTIVVEAVSATTAAQDLVLRPPRRR